MVNEMKDELKFLNVSKLTFLPSIDIRQLSPDPQFNQKFDIVSSQADALNPLEQLTYVDIDKLNKYFEVNVAIGHKQNGILSYHVVPFIQCKKSFFSKLHDDSF